MQRRDAAREVWIVSQGLQNHDVDKIIAFTTIRRDARGERPEFFHQGDDALGEARHEKRSIVTVDA